MTIPKGRVIEVTATIVLPETATEEQVSEWVEHCIFQQGSISVDNPLLPLSGDTEDIDWDDTGSYRETTISDVERTENGVKYRQSRRNRRDERTPEEVDAWKSPDQVRAEALPNQSS